MPTQRRETASVIVGIAIIALSAFLVFALGGGDEPEGKVNSILNRSLYTYFNYLAWMLPLAGVYWGWKLVVGRPYRRTIVFSVFLSIVYLTLATFSHVATLRTVPRPANIGGLLGALMGRAAVDVFGSYGSCIVTVACLVIFFVLVTRISVRKGAMKVEQAVKSIPGLFFPPMEDGGMKARAKVSRRHVAQEEEETAADGLEREEDREGRGARPVITAASADRDETRETKTRLAPRPPVPSARADVGQERLPLEGWGEADGDYEYPPLSLFEDAESGKTVSDEELGELAASLEDKFGKFDVTAKVVEIHPGPVITRFELEPGSSTKVHQVVNLADDLALALKARSIRILAPIPGKGTIGIEVPNRHPVMVRIKEILATKRFTSSPSKLELAIGKDVAGNPYAADLEAMPHLLIAGATGSGKSVCINTIITSLVCRNSPQDVQLLLIDPKRLELSVYEGIPHLVSQVVTEPKKAVMALGWVIEEMDLRYQLLASRGVRNIQSYEEGLPYIVVIIDELADLMLAVPQEMETAVSKLAQMARAVGIHLVVATQRPSVDVITGVIKANFPCRIAFKVASKTDSRTIIDYNGAERLLGKGDMLLLPPACAEPVRVHGAYVSSSETQKLVEFLRGQSHLAAPAFSLESTEHRDLPSDRSDELFDDAARIVVTHKQGSVSLLQRRLRVGYSRAARLIDLLEAAGIVGPFEGSKARQVLVDESYLENLSGKH